MYFNSIQFSLLNDTDSAVLNISEDLDLLGKLFFFEHMLKENCNSTFGNRIQKIICGISNSILQTKVKLGN